MELPHSPGPGRVGPRMRRFLWVAIAVAIAGEGGHQLFDRYGSAVGHHFFHYVMVGGAVLVFVALAAFDVRRNGRPRFAWHQ